MYRTFSPVVPGFFLAAFFLAGTTAPELAGRRTLAQKPQESRPARKADEAKAAAKPAQAVVERLSSVWTCSMHPHIRQSAAGKCPICGMDLIGLSHAGLQQADRGGVGEMPAAALRGSPEVRAAEARVRVAEAELELARWQALERIIALRRERRRQQAELHAAEAELRQAERAAGAADGADDRAAASRQLVQAARQRVQLQREQLAETEAMLLHLAGGRARAATAHDQGNERRRLIEKELLPTAQSGLETSSAAYRAGETTLDDVLAWSLRVAELKQQLAPTPAAQLAALESQREILEEILAVAEAKYKAAQAAITEVLAVKYQLAELKLKILDLRRGRR